MRKMLRSRFTCKWLSRKFLNKKPVRSGGHRIRRGTQVCKWHCIVYSVSSHVIWAFILLLLYRSEVDYLLPWGDREESTSSPSHSPFLAPSASCLGGYCSSRTVLCRRSRSYAKVNCAEVRTGGGVGWVGEWTDTNKESRESRWSVDGICNNCLDMMLGV